MYWFTLQLFLRHFSPYNYSGTCNWHFLCESTLFVVWSTKPILSLFWVPIHLSTKVCRVIVLIKDLWVIHKEQPTENSTLVLTVPKNIASSSRWFLLACISSQTMLGGLFFLRVLPKFHIHILLFGFKFPCPTTLCSLLSCGSHPQGIKQINNFSKTFIGKVQDFSEAYSKELSHLTRLRFTENI